MLQRNLNNIITHFYISTIMVPLAKPAVISQIEGEGSLAKAVLFFIIFFTF